MSDFPKHYDHNEAEPRLQKFWADEKLYVFDAAQDPEKEIFSVDTPPPYVSADHLHVGHAMSYSQAEIVVRYHRMRGYKVFYPMGFDDNGLPTERFVEKKYKVNKNKINRKDFIDLCLKETAKGSETYRKLWTALGISVDWNLSYSTINEHCRKTAQHSFIDLYDKGHIERREEPIIWCYQCQTSLAQADVEAEERDSHLHDVRFQDINGRDLIISTTRPELIPACVALYVHPEDERYQNLMGQKAVVPLVDRQVPIKTDESVDKEFGTGLMMVCTWGDMEDVRKWKEHELETRLIFNPNGQLNDRAGPLAGVYYNKARKTILEKLKEADKLIKSQPIRHSVGVHERCSTPIDFNQAPQWFIKTLAFKEELLKRGNELNWHPPFMKVRFDQWTRDLKWDWNISRQRYYGVPFPVWYCDQCQKAIIPTRDQLPLDPMVDAAPVKKCPHCQGEDLKPETDVMDTWMTSSLTPLIASGWADNPDQKTPVYPMTVRPQAFEIIRTWLFYTVLKSHLHTNSLPWRDVMISGWGLDPKGKKISKRAGNFVDAHQVIEKYSADALRFWAAGSTLGHDLRYNERDVATGRKIVVKIWNAIKFVQMNLNQASLTPKQGKDSSPKAPSNQPMGRDPSVLIDKWALSHLHHTIKEATQAFESYEYSHALRAIERFFWQTYCDNYLEIVKDRFWNPEAYSEAQIKSAQDTLYVVSRDVIKLLAPFLPFITEEVWQRYFIKHEQVKSIHIAPWPLFDKSHINENAEAGGQLLLNCLVPIRKFKSQEKIHQNKALKEICLFASDNQKPTLEAIADDLASASRAEKLSIAALEKAPAEALTTEIDGLRVSITV